MPQGQYTSAVVSPPVDCCFRHAIIHVTVSGRFSIVTVTEFVHNGYQCLVPRCLAAVAMAYVRGSLPAMCGVPAEEWPSPEARATVESSIADATLAKWQGTGRDSTVLSGGRRKRIFDCLVTLLYGPFWLPVVVVCAVLILLLEGRPVFYVSHRQVAKGIVRPILKFRTMRRNADKILNRDTVPVVKTVFLNIPRDADVYTPIGRLIERLALTELPQLFHVLSGTMSLIGSRPLPSRVMDILRARYPHAEDRFLTSGGLTGPVQLIGRDAISDSDRLALEAEYCHIAASDAYRMRLDLWLLFYTVVVVLNPRKLLTVAQVREVMRQRIQPSRRIADRRPLVAVTDTQND